MKNLYHFKSHEIKKRRIFGKILVFKYRLRFNGQKLKIVERVVKSIKTTPQTAVLGFSRKA